MSLSGKYFIDKCAVRYNNGSNTDDYVYLIDKLEVEIEPFGSSYTLADGEYREYIKYYRLNFSLDKSHFEATQNSGPILNAKVSFPKLLEQLTKTGTFTLIPDFSQPSNGAIVVVPLLVGKKHKVLSTNQGRRQKGFKIGFTSKNTVAPTVLDFYKLY